MTLSWFIVAVGEGINPAWISAQRTDGARIPIGAEAVHVQTGRSASGQVLLDGKRRAVHAAVAGARRDDANVIILDLDGIIESVVRNGQINDHWVSVIGLLWNDAAFSNPKDGLAAFCAKAGVHWAAPGDDVVCGGQRKQGLDAIGDGIG